MRCGVDEIGVHAPAGAQLPALPCCDVDTTFGAAGELHQQGMTAGETGRDLVVFPLSSMPIRRKVWCSVGKPEFSELTVTKTPKRGEQQAVFRRVAAGWLPKVRR